MTAASIGAHIQWFAAGRGKVTKAHRFFRGVAAARAPSRPEKGWPVACPLRERCEDIAAGPAWETVRQLMSRPIGIHADAMARYPRFATNPATGWPGNDRDLPAARLCLALHSEPADYSDPTLKYTSSYTRIS